MKRWFARHLNVLFWSIAAPFLGLFVVFGLPIFGNLAAAGLTSIAGCRDSSMSLSDCVLFGQDISRTLYMYGIGIFLGGIINPLMFVELLGAYLASWIVMLWSGVAMLLSLAKIRRYFRAKRKIKNPVLPPSHS